MAISRFVDRTSLSAAEAHVARVAEHGSGSHRHLVSLLRASGHNAARDIADAVHLLCGLHGTNPGLIETAHLLAGDELARHWLGGASEVFERERSYLVSLTSAVGPIPSTPGAAETESTLVAQRHALEILANSERHGCALGAAAALVSDWWSIRPLLDTAAKRLGMNVPANMLPDDASVSEMIGAACATAASERALGFGGEQLLLQHRGLLDLLEARAAARGDY